MIMIDIKKLELWQRSNTVHPFTCGRNRTDDAHFDGEGVLMPTESGWLCPYCDYSQEYGSFEEKISSAPALVQEHIQMTAQTMDAQYPLMMEFFQGTKPTGTK